MTSKIRVENFQKNQLYRFLKKIAYTFARAKI